ncbi:hypothetical protein [Demequina muriae]|uniref:RES domain-containing protein n=1 Tax=Demequina muriae TaxID=3051664 RepID=A0ABT8GG33_9MICO|nr:hypothetical protein [Demequina sp. EGI L300058]MDN4480385.1 hypothetical protein [Demequina sp. EGI L300058]
MPTLMHDLLDIPDIVPHLLYGTFSLEEPIRGAFTSGTGRDVYRAERTFGAEPPDVAFSYQSSELPPWIYVVGATTLFSDSARETIEGYLSAQDRIAYFERTIEMADGPIEVANLAYSTEWIDVLSPHSTVAPHGVAMWWALELSKLRHRAFFIVPEARVHPVMRGDLLLALHELGWPGYAYELRVMDGKHMVSYEEWAEHPEWTGYEPTV